MIKTAWLQFLKIFLEWTVFQKRSRSQPTTCHLNQCQHSTDMMLDLEGSQPYQLWTINRKELKVKLTVTIVWNRLELAESDRLNLKWMILPQWVSIHHRSPTIIFLKLWGIINLICWRVLQVIWQLLRVILALQMHLLETISMLMKKIELIK